MSRSSIFYGIIEIHYYPVYVNNAFTINTYSTYNINIKITINYLTNKHNKFNYMLFICQLYYIIKITIIHDPQTYYICTTTY